MNKPFGDAPQAWCASEATKAYGTGDRGKMATQALQLGVNYLTCPPIGWNVNSTQAQLKQQLTKHISKNIQPSGFLALPIFGWLLWQVLGGIISWAVGLLLER